MKSDYLGITIDRTRDKRMSDQARELVTGYYLKGKEKSPQEAKGLPLLFLILRT